MWLTLGYLWLAVVATGVVRAGSTRLERAADGLAAYGGALAIIQDAVIAAVLQSNRSTLYEPSRSRQLSVLDGAALRGGR
jgi:hypothetical protein